MTPGWKAKANLTKVHLVGLSEKFDAFLEVLESRYGWELGETERFRESTEPWLASPALRGQIAADNAADVEFYEFAARPVPRRSLRRGRTVGDGQLDAVSGMSRRPLGPLGRGAHSRLSYCSCRPSFSNMSWDGATPAEISSRTLSTCA